MLADAEQAEALGTLQVFAQVPSLEPRARSGGDLAAALGARRRYKTPAATACHAATACPLAAASAATVCCLILASGPMVRATDALVGYRVCWLSPPFAAEDLA